MVYFTQQELYAEALAAAKTGRFTYLKILLGPAPLVAKLSRETLRKKLALQGQVILHRALIKSLESVLQWLRHQQLNVAFTSEHAERMKVLFEQSLSSNLPTTPLALLSPESEQEENYHHLLKRAFTSHVKLDPRASFSREMDSELMSGLREEYRQAQIHYHAGVLLSRLEKNDNLTQAMDMILDYQNELQIKLTGDSSHLNRRVVLVETIPDNHEAADPQIIYLVKRNQKVTKKEETRADGEVFQTQKIEGTLLVYFYKDNQWCIKDFPLADSPIRIIAATVSAEKPHEFIDFYIVHKITSLVIPDMKIIPDHSLEKRLYQVEADLKKQIKETIKVHDKQAKTWLTYKSAMIAVPASSSSELPVADDDASRTRSDSKSSSISIEALSERSKAEAFSPLLKKKWQQMMVQGNQGSFSLPRSSSASSQVSSSSQGSDAELLNPIMSELLNAEVPLDLHDGFVDPVNVAGPASAENTSSPKRWSLLTLAMGESNKNTPNEPDYEMVKYLLEAGAQMDCYDAENKTPMQRAIESQDPLLMSLFVLRKDLLLGWPLLPELAAIAPNGEDAYLFYAQAIGTLARAYLDLRQREAAKSSGLWDEITTLFTSEAIANEHFKEAKAWELAAHTARLTGNTEPLSELVEKTLEKGRMSVRPKSAGRFYGPVIPIHQAHKVNMALIQKAASLSQSLEQAQLLAQEVETRRLKAEVAAQQTKIEKLEMDKTTQQMEIDQLKQQMAQFALLAQSFQSLSQGTAPSPLAARAAADDRREAAAIKSTLIHSIDGEAEEFDASARNENGGEPRPPSPAFQPYSGLQMDT